MLRSGGRLGRDVGRLLRDGVDPPGGDARLLHRFAADRDPSAFEAIVDRHGPPVLAVCKRYLRDPADVEDAFQATFLVLVRKAGGLRDGDALSSWLYGVAYRVAVRARSNALKRRGREGEREGLQDAPAEPSRPADDALEVLDAELSRLPEKYRAPLALCYLDGRTHDQAAAELGWPVGTVRSRMAKGRSLLRERLSRRGVDAPACLVALRSEIGAIPTVPSSLVAATASAAVRFAGLPVGLAWLGASPSSSTWPAARLALGVLATMSTTPWKALGLTFACAGLTAAALAAGSQDAPGGPQDPPKPQEPPAAEKPAASDVEARLSEVEGKLDRMMGLLESLAAKPASASVEPGLTPSPAPVFEARTLREIEAQLYGLGIKYEIVQRSTRGPDVGINPFQVENLHEDAIAPARVLVARLREMEDACRSQLAQSERGYGLPPGTLDDRDKATALVEARFREAEDRVKRSEDALKKLGFDVKNPARRGFGDFDPFAGREALQEHRDAQGEKQKLATFLGRAELPPPGLRSSVQRDSSVLDTLAPTYAKLDEIRRLIAWAKSQFPGVERTIDDAPPVRGDAVK